APARLPPCLLSDPPTPGVYPLSLHDALPISQRLRVVRDVVADEAGDEVVAVVVAGLHAQVQRVAGGVAGGLQQLRAELAVEELVDRKSTRLNSSHVKISYAVFCLKKKNRNLF